MCFGGILSVVSYLFEFSDMSAFGAFRFQSSLPSIYQPWLLVEMGAEVPNDVQAGQTVCFKLQFQACLTYQDVTSSSVSLFLVEIVRRQLHWRRRCSLAIVGPVRVGISIECVSLSSPA